MRIKFEEMLLGEEFYLGDDREKFTRFIKLDKNWIQVIEIKRGSSFRVGEKYTHGYKNMVEAEEQLYI